MHQVGNGQEELELRQQFAPYLKAQEQIKNELSVESNKETVGSSSVFGAQEADLVNIDDDWDETPMIESSYDDGDDLRQRLLASQCLMKQKAIPSQMAKF